MNFTKLSLITLTFLSVGSSIFASQQPEKKQEKETAKTTAIQDDITKLIEKVIEQKDATEELTVDTIATAVLAKLSQAEVKTNLEGIKQGLHTKITQILAAKKKQAQGEHTQPQSSSTQRSPLLNAFSCFNIHKRNLGSGFYMEGIPNILWTEELLPLLDIRQYLPSLKAITTFPRVTSAVFSPSRAQILTGSCKVAQLWDIGNNEKPVATFKHGNDWLSSVAFDPSGTQILTASKDGAARLWNIDNNQQPLATFQHNSRIISAIFNPKGTQILTVCNDNTAQLWNINNSEQPLIIFQHDHQLYSAVFNHNGTQILTASKDRRNGSTTYGIAQLWDIGNNQKPLATFKHDSWITSAVFNHNSTQILTTSYRAAQLWNVSNGKKPVATFKHGSSWLCSAVFNSYGTQILTASKDGTAQLWDIDNSQQPLATFQHNILSSVMFNSNSTQILTISDYDGTAQLWSISLFSKKFTPEQAAFIWLCKDYYDNSRYTGLIRSFYVDFADLTKQFTKEGVTITELERVLKTFTADEQEALIKSYNIQVPQTTLQKTSKPNNIEISSNEKKPSSCSIC